MSTTVLAFLEYVKKMQRPIALFRKGETVGAVEKFRALGPEDLGATLLMEEDLEGQVQRCSGEIVHWGVQEAEARAAWQAAETGYRVWRDNVVKTASTPPPGAKDWKKPTEAVIEATYRTDPRYVEYQEMLQNAELACSACHAMLEGFKAKKELMIHTIRRRREDSAPTLSI